MKIETVQMTPINNVMDLTNDLLSWLPLSSVYNRAHDVTPLADQSVSALHDDAVAFAKIILRVRELEQVRRLHQV